MYYKTVINKAKESSKSLNPNLFLLYTKDLTEYKFLHTYNYIRKGASTFVYLSSPAHF